MSDLTFRQRMFVAAYLGESAGNATDAARRAGYAHPNNHGARLIVKASIRAAIDAQLDGAALSANEVLARISDLATASLGDFLDIDEHGHRVNLRKGKLRGRLGVLKKIKTKVRTFKAKGDEEPTTEVETEIELCDKLAALEKLARFHGLDARTAILIEQNRELKARLDALESDRESGQQDLPPRAQPTQAD